MAVCGLRAQDFFPKIDGCDFPRKFYNNYSLSAQFLPHLIDVIFDLIDQLHVSQMDLCGL